MSPKARGGAADSGADCTAFVFSSLQGLEQLAVTAGDAGVLALALSFHHLVTAQYIACGGIAWSTAGDAVFAGFGDVTQALLAALAVQRVLRSHGEEHPGSLMRAGIAVDVLAAGEAGSDGLSMIVHRTARIAIVARPSQVVASEAVYRTVQGLGAFRTRPLGRAQYWGVLEDDRRLYEITGTRAPQAQGLWNDVRRLNLASLLHRSAHASLLAKLADAQQRLAALAAERSR